MPLPWNAPAGQHPRTVPLQYISNQAFTIEESMDVLRAPSFMKTWAAYEWSQLLVVRRLADEAVATAQLLAAPADRKAGARSAGERAGQLRQPPRHTLCQLLVDMGVASVAMPTGAPAPAPAPKSPAVAAAPTAAAAPGAQRSSRSRTAAEQLEKRQNPIGRTVCSV